MLTEEKIVEITEAYCDANMKCDDETGLYDVQPGCEARRDASRVWLTVAGVGLLLEHIEALTAELAQRTVERDELAENYRIRGEEVVRLNRAGCMLVDKLNQARADLAALREREHRLEHELRQERERRESLERRHANLIESQKHYGESRVDMERRLDALLWVWCSGGCDGGMLRWTDLEQYGGRAVAFDDRVVSHAIENTNRLVSWWRNDRFRPIYHRFLSEGQPWREALKLASAELDRLYPSTVHALLATRPSGPEQGASCSACEADESGMCTPHLAETITIMKHPEQGAEG